MSQDERPDSTDAEVSETIRESKQEREIYSGRALIDVIGREK